MAEASFVASDGVRIAYFVDDFTDRWKKAPTVLMLHAAMGSSDRYFAWVPTLSRHFRVVRMDLRGHGASGVPPVDPPLSMERLVADVRELMDGLGIEAAHLVGNSAGGYIAQQLAMASPARVLSLSLFGSTPGLARGGVAPWITRIGTEGLRSFLAATIADRFPMDRVDPGMIEWFLDDAARNDSAYIARFVTLMSSLWWGDRLGEIRCPTMLVIPGAETVGSIGDYEVMRDNIADIEIVVYDGLPHNVGEAVPERCAEDVRRFVTARFPAA